MTEQRVSIPVSGAERTSGVLALPAEKTKRTGIVVAHGAGNNMETPLLKAFSEGLARAGYPVLRFNFLYSEHGRKAPDKYEALAETWRSAAAFFRERINDPAASSRVSKTTSEARFEGEAPAAYAAGGGDASPNNCRQIDSWVAAGKSMGGRIASQMVADGLLEPNRLIFLGYPLHPAGKKESLRDAHLYRIAVPMLFFAGTRDPLCNLEKLRSVLDRIASPRNLHVIEGGDHSFHVPKSQGTTDGEIYETILRETVRWLGKERG